jgi:hypothetical protein
VLGINEMVDWSDQEAKELLMSEDYTDNYTNYWNTDLASLTELTEQVVDDLLSDFELEDLPEDHPHVMASR